MLRSKTSHLLTLSLSMLLFAWSAVATAGPITIRPTSNNSTIPAGLSKVINWNITNLTSNSSSYRFAATNPVTALPPKQISPKPSPGNKITDYFFTPPPHLENVTLPKGKSVTVNEKLQTSRVPPSEIPVRYQIDIAVTSFAGFMTSTEDLGTSVRVNVTPGTLGVDFTGGAPVIPVADVNVGFRFDLTSTKAVAALGLWDEGANGIAPHEVGLWKLADPMMASLGIQAGPTLIYQTTIDSVSGDAYAGAEAAGTWRFSALDQLIQLGPGTYVIGAHYSAGSPDAYRTDATGTALNLILPEPGLVFRGAQHGPSSGFDYPGLLFPTEIGDFGPNLIFVGTPEPKSLTLVVIAGLTLLALRHLGFFRGNRKSSLQTMANPVHSL